jgi:hypothetical protein
MTDKLKSINIKGNEYVMVHERIRAFHEKHPNGFFETEIIRLDEKGVLFKCTVYPNCENQEIIYVAHAYERQGDTFINKTSHIENAETSAVGRALGMLGIGIDTSLASAEEVSNAIQSQGKKEKPQAIAKQPTRKDKIAKIMNLSAKHFEDEDYFAMWRIDNGLVEKIEKAKDEELLVLYKRMKEL